MSGNQYLLQVITRHTASILMPQVALNHFNPLIQRWASNYLLGTRLSGSNAKGTAVKLCADVDLFISLSPNLDLPLATVYGSLYYFFAKRPGYQPRKQNVSIRVNLGLGSVDLVPAKKQANYTGDHSLYVKKKGSWTQTNIDTHISVVKAANKSNIIRLTKIWRERNQLDFPSLYLELAVIRSLQGYTSDLEGQFFQVLSWLGNNITKERFVDPSNSNNVLSDDLTSHEKQAISKKALESLNASAWTQVVW